MSDLKELSQSQIPLERVSPLNSNRLVTFVNHFIVSIVQQLNELSSVVDSRLYDINNQMIRCNANLVILEMKLNSISGLSTVSSVVNNTNTNQINGNNLEEINDGIDSTKDLPQNSQLINESDRSETTNGETKTDENEVINGQNNDNNGDNYEESEPEDPRIARYKKMIHLGIPLDAVHQKMRMEGVDTQLL